jgi:hypothetical protein
MGLDPELQTTKDQQQVVDLAFPKEIKGSRSGSQLPLTAHA